MALPGDERPAFLPPIQKPAPSLTGPAIPDFIREAALYGLSPSVRGQLADVPLFLRSGYGGGGYYEGRQQFTGYRPPPAPTPEANPVAEFFAGLGRAVNPPHGTPTYELRDRRIEVGGDDPNEALTAARHEYGHAISNATREFGPDDRRRFTGWRREPIEGSWTGATRSEPIFTPPYQHFTRAVIGSEAHRASQQYDRYFRVLQETARNTDPQRFQTELFANIFQHLSEDDLPPPLRAYLAPAFDQMPKRGPR